MVVAAGILYLSAVTILIVRAAPLGSPLFLVCCGAASIAYLMVLRRATNVPDAQDRRGFRTAILFALAFRAILASGPIDARSDTLRYVWDGRVQRAGFNPYAVRPDDARVAAIQTAETRAMPSLHEDTAYPPFAQLVFRFVVAIRDSVHAMRGALVVCDLLTMVIVWRWLRETGRNEQLLLVYAWNPLVVLEISGGGHVDALAALCAVACAYALARRRTLLASVALALAIGAKLLPLVLAPLLWRRVRLRDAAAGVALLGLMYLPFALGGDPFVRVSFLVQNARFNAPVFRWIAAATTPRGAAAAAILLGLATAVWTRRRLAVTDAAAWAWPMAVAVAAANVVYPWYLVSLTPFLFVPSTLPLLVWTIAILPVYVVWELAAAGARWAVPVWLVWIEYGVVIAGAVVTITSVERNRTDAVRG